MLKKLLIIAPISALSKRVRMKKISTIFYENGFQIFHLGWERMPGEQKEELAYNISKKIIIKGGGYSNKATRFLYIIWILKVFWFLLFNGRKFSAIYCLGFESALPAVFANFINKKRIVFDDADRLLLILSFPAIVKKILLQFEKMVSSKVFIHIIPNKNRYEYSSKKMVEIKNTPDEYEYNKAMELEVDFVRKNLTIYINGWLHKIRGIPIFYEVAKRLRNEKITFLVAGRDGCEEAKQLKALPNVVNLGELDNYTAMAYYKVSDIVVTFYDPIMEINRYAEANKWGDAIFFNVPVIVNSEVKTAKFLIDSNSCFSFKYNDIEGITTLLKTLISNRRLLLERKNNLKKLRKHSIFFDKAIKNYLKSILSENY